MIEILKIIASLSITIALFYGFYKIGRQRAYDDLLKQFKDAVMVIGKQDAIIQAYKQKLEEMEKEVQVENNINKVNNMIDEKTIERAAQNHYPINDMLGEQARNSFKAGAKWFRNAIWHHEDEVPETDKYLLLHLHSYEGQNAFGFRIIHTGIDVDVKDSDKKQQWEAFCAFCVLYPFDWCYIDDLLSKKGGDK